MKQPPISVVIICKNAAATLVATIEAAQQVSSDIIVLDSGSTDGSQDIVQATTARLLERPWVGYGPTKNAGNEAARHDWILSIDADECIDETLAQAIQKIDFSNATKAYALKRLNYLGQQPIHFGEWKNDWVVRLFNRQYIKWNDALVHETLIVPPTISVEKLEGVLHHYTTTDIDSYNKKLEAYAQLMAERYYKQGKKAGPIKKYASSTFSFLKHYVLELGCLDKRAGWQIAVAHASYTFKKYQQLEWLHKKTHQA